LAGSKERSLWTNDEEEALREGIQKCVGGSARPSRLYSERKRCES
jgi:hypothetical protein